MSAIDACEPQIIRAFEKDGWQIVEKPHAIPFHDRAIFADFRARHLNEDGESYIVVMEVKCFTNPKHDLAEVYTAIGQYQLYAAAMIASEDTYPLYLAIPYAAYQRFEVEFTFLSAFSRAGVKLVIVDVVQEVVIQWIP